MNFNLGYAINQERKRRGWSLRDVAKLMKCSHQCVADVEAGGGNLDTAIKIAWTIGIPRMQIYKFVVLDIRNLISKVTR